MVIRNGLLRVEIGSEITNSSVLRASAGAFIPEVFEFKAKGKEDEVDESGTPNGTDKEERKVPGNKKEEGARGFTR